MLAVNVFNGQPGDRFGECEARRLNISLIHDPEFNWRARAMTTSVTGRVPLDRISERAHAARPGRTALAVIAMVLFGLGWLAYKSCAVAWLGVAWCGSAVIEGWQEARRAETVRRARAGRPR